MDEGSSDSEEYAVVTDSFMPAHGIVNKEHVAYMEHMAFPDIAEGTRDTRLREQIVIMTTETDVKSYNSEPFRGTARMICVNEHYALAAETTLPYEEEERIADADADARHYRQRMQKMTSRLQYKMLVDECKSRKLMALGDAAFLDGIMAEAKKQHDALPKSTDPAEVAEIPSAKTAAEAALGKPWPHHKDTTDRIIFATGVTVVYKSVADAWYTKSRTKRKPRIESPVDRESMTLRLAQLSRADYPRWSTRFALKCRGNAKTCFVDKDIVIVVDSMLIKARDYWVVHLRCVKTYNHKNCVAEWTVHDTKHVLGAPVQVYAADLEHIWLLFQRHALCYNSVTREVTETITLDKAFATAIVCTVDEVVIGTFNGVIYFVRSNRYVDLPLAVPVRGLALQAPSAILLAYTTRSIYRFHEDLDVPPYELHVGRPHGVAACGSLVCSMSHVGSIWVADALTLSGQSRQFTPPKHIAKKHEWDDGQRVYWQLDVPMSYDYKAVWMGRTVIHALYPDGTIRRIVFKIKKVM